MTLTLHNLHYVQYTTELPGSFTAMIKFGDVRPGLYSATKISKLDLSVGEPAERLFNKHIPPETPPYGCMILGILA